MSPFSLTESLALICPLFLATPSSSSDLHGFCEEMFAWPLSRPFWLWCHLPGLIDLPGPVLSLCLLWSRILDPGPSIKSPPIGLSCALAETAVGIPCYFPALPSTCSGTVWEVSHLIPDSMVLLLLCAWPGMFFLLTALPPPDWTVESTALQPSKVKPGSRFPFTTREFFGPEKVL